jgi:hypothetical protein
MSLIQLDPGIVDQSLSSNDQLAAIEDKLGGTGLVLGVDLPDGR